MEKQKQKQVSWLKNRNQEQTLVHLWDNIQESNTSWEANHLVSPGDTQPTIPDILLVSGAKEQMSFQ